METFTLIAWIWGADGHREHRLPGLSDLGCKIMLAEVKEPQRATCVREPLKPLCDGCKCYMVCSFGGYCWVAEGVPKVD
jgi:hypothetical protein